MQSALEQFLLSTMRTENPEKVQSFVKESLLILPTLKRRLWQRNISLFIDEELPDTKWNNDILIDALCKMTAPSPKVDSAE